MQRDIDRQRLRLALAQVSRASPHAEEADEGEDVIFRFSSTFCSVLRDGCEYDMRAIE